MDLFAENLVLRTTRLLLRPVVLSDEAPIVRAINDIAVAGWLATVPHPYTSTDFRSFVTEIAKPGETFAVDDAAGFAGVVGIEGGELGYWFVPQAQGQGYATEAAKAALQWYFSRTTESILAGYFIGNAPSARVLEKLGFTQTGLGLKHCTAMNQDRPHAELVLTPEAFVRSDRRASGND